MEVRQGWEKKKRKCNQLFEELWSKVWEPVERIIPETAAAMDWKELCKSQVGWKKTFAEAAEIYNGILRNSKKDEETERKETSLPTLFMAEEDLYTFCSLAQSSNEFTMKIPRSISKSYPSVARLDANDDEEFKPSLTRCQIIQEATYRGRPVTKVKLWPITGRRHQLRVHTALSGHAILGDVSYCNVNQQETLSKVRLPPRMCLHAHSLALPLLGEREDWSITTPDPFSVVEGEVVILEI